MGTHENLASGICKSSDQRCPGGWENIVDWPGGTERMGRRADEAIATMQNVLAGDEGRPLDEPQVMTALV